MMPSSNEFVRVRRELRKRIIAREKVDSFNEVGGGIGILVGHDDMLKYLPKHKLQKQWKFLYRVSIKDPATKKAKTVELYDGELNRVATVRHPNAPKPEKAPKRKRASYA